MADYQQSSVQQGGRLQNDPRNGVALRILQTHFGYDSFRAGQRELIEAILSKRDCVGVMPTGAGKSICYQVPALALSGLTLVISPLVSLMHDQVNALSAAGIPAAYLNSQLLYFERDEVLWRASNGEYKLLYVAPERLGDPAFLSFARDASISLVAVDEAHCVSQWGQDFRPSYLGIADFIAQLSEQRERPVVAAFTATATPLVADDIARLLRLHDPLSITTGFDRPNLRFEVERLAEKQKGKRLLEVVRQFEGESGIVYCSTRKTVEAVQDFLVRSGVAATRYHAGLSDAERNRNQHSFVNDDAPVIVATNAFGMGIDKSNVRFVVHYNMPGSLEAYYQEAGRAGRDGEPSTCLLLWNESDINTARFFIEQDSGNEALTPQEAAAVLANQRRRLNAMTGYCLTADCLRAIILRYFGDKQMYERTASEPERASSPDYTPPASHEGCGNCSNCCQDVRSQAIDVTVTARSIMRCVHELRGRYGKNVVADVLTGSKSAKMYEWGLDTKRTYNIVSEPASTVKDIIELLAASDYLEISAGRYPLVGLGPRAREAATDEFRLYMKRKPRKQASSSRSTAASWKTPSGSYGASSRPQKPPADSRNAKPSEAQSQHPALGAQEQQELFERLRVLRKQLAADEGVPPYIIFSDAALHNMCECLPQNDDEFLAVNGVGQVKLKRYGAAFLAEINSYLPQDAEGPKEDTPLWVPSN